MKKVSEWVIRSKSEQFAHLLIFGERPERFALDRSFLLSELSESLTVAHLSWMTWAIRSLCSEGMSESFPLKKNLFKKCKKRTKNTIFLSDSLIFCEQKRKWAICLKKPSNSLIFPEQPEQIAHSRSFILSDLIKLLTFAYLSWATPWAIRSQSLIFPERFEGMREWAMSEFSTLILSNYINRILYWWLRISYKMWLSPFHN